MVSKNEHCDQRRLQALLDDRLPEVEQSTAAGHLEDCPTCRDHLERLAADNKCWSQAEEFLPNDRTDTEWLAAKKALDSGTQVYLGTTDGGHGDDSNYFPADLLEAPRQPGLLGRLDAYDVMEVIQKGNCGVVLKAFDHDLNRYVAIKVMSPQYASHAAARQRFAREAQAAAAVVHPHVIPIHAVNANVQFPYLVMPYVAGQSLQQRIDKTGALCVPEILRIGMQIADGLAAAHAQGLVHRDIKPGNILLEKNVERVVLADFGLARAVDDATLTKSGVIAGTPQYMSPEQASGEAVDFRTDLFSLGSVLYSMSTGHAPFRAETTMAVLKRICEAKPREILEVNPAIPDWLARVIMKLLAKNPQDRYQSAKEVADLLERCLAHVHQPLQAPLPQQLVLRNRRFAVVDQASQWVRTHARASLAVLLGTIILGGGIYAWPRVFSRQENREKSDTVSVPSETSTTENVDAAKSRSPAPTLETLNWNEREDRDLLQLDYELHRLERQLGEE